MGMSGRVNKDYPIYSYTHSPTYPLMKILIVDDERSVLRSLERLFFDDDYEILTAESGEQGLGVLEKEYCPIIIADYRMPGMTGVEFLREVRKKLPQTVRLVLSGYADVASIVEAINVGEIYKFMPKPWNDEELKVTVANAIDKYRLEQENINLTEELKKKNEELEKLNLNLEQRVEEKTVDLIFQNQILMASQKILDALPFAIVGVDNEYIVVQANRAAETMFSLTEGTILGKNAKKFLADEVVALSQKIRNEDYKSSQITISEFKGTVHCVVLFQQEVFSGWVFVFVENAD